MTKKTDQILQNDINHYCMCLSSPRTWKTKDGDDIAKTQTQMFPLMWSPTRRLSKGPRVEMCSPPPSHHSRLVAELNTVRSKAWGRVLPAWPPSPPPAPKQPGVKRPCVLHFQTVSPHRRAQVNKWWSQCLRVFSVPCVHHVTAPPPPSPNSTSAPVPPPYLYSSGIWLLWQWLRLILLSAG